MQTPELLDTLLAYHIVVSPPQIQDSHPSYLPNDKTAPNATAVNYMNGTYVDFLDSAYVVDGVPQRLKVVAEVDGNGDDVADITVYGGFNDHANVLDILKDEVNHATVYVIDEVLTPPEGPSVTLKTLGSEFLEKLESLDASAGLCEKLDGLKDVTV
jgi:hypothetical protein